MEVGKLLCAGIAVIEPAVTDRVCPCGHIVSQHSAQLAGIDFLCPRCREYRVSQFRPALFEPEPLARVARMNGSRVWMRSTVDNPNSRDETAPLRGFLSDLGWD